MLPLPADHRHPVKYDPAAYYAYAGSSREQLLPELARMLRLRWRVMAACALGCLVLSVAYVLLKSPRYQASARIEVSPAGTNSMGLDELSSRMLNPSDPTIQLQSAVSVLKSTTVAMAVMQQTKLAERQDFAGRWRQPAGTDLGDLSPEARDQLLFRFQKGLSVEIVPKTDIITVQFRAKDPAVAADVVNAIVSSYAERNFRSSYDSATQVSTWLSAQMEDLKLKANQAQEKLAALQKKRGLIGADETDNIVTDKLKDLNEQLTSAEADRIVKEARYRIAGSGNPELIASAIPEPTLQVLRSQQAQLRVDYAKLSTKFGEGYPKLAEMGNQMAQVDGAITEELKNLTQRYKNDYTASANAEKMLRGKFEQQKQKAYELSEGAAQYAILKHEVETSQDLYQTLQLKLKQAGIVAGLASANIGVVEPGQVPSEPVDPKPLRDIPLGAGGGLALGILSALVLEVLDNTVRDGDETERFSGLSVLAEIPQMQVLDGDGEGNAWAIPMLRRRLHRKSEPTLRLVAHCEPLSPASECYRSLRTSLLATREERPQVVAVTSALPSEGKSLTALNCAVVLAQHGASVLLVDADLRQPSLHTAFELPQEPGLSELLTGMTSSQEAEAKSSTLPDLTVLTAGRARGCPAESLAGADMAARIADWRARFDYVVLDTPPVSLFTDAVQLGRQADAVLLVARYGVTTRYALGHTVEVLRRGNAEPVGIVLNGIDPKYRDSYYHRYGYPVASWERAGQHGLS